MARVVAVAPTEQGCRIKMTAEGDETRRSPRDSVFLLCLLHGEGGREIGPAKVRNLSSTGMLVETNVALSIGEHLQFELRGIGPASGVVVREEPGRFRYGVHFDRPVDPSLARREITGTTVVPRSPPTRKFPV